MDYFVPKIILQTVNARHFAKQTKFSFRLCLHRNELKRKHKSGVVLSLFILPLVERYGGKSACI